MRREQTAFTLNLLIRKVIFSNSMWNETFSWTVNSAFIENGESEISCTLVGFHMLLKFNCQDQFKHKQQGYSSMFSCFSGFPLSNTLLLTLSCGLVQLLSSFILMQHTTTRDPQHTPRIVGRSFLAVVSVMNYSIPCNDSLSNRILIGDLFKCCAICGGGKKTVDVNI